MTRRSFDFADMPPRPVPPHVSPVIVVLAIVAACFGMAVVVVFGVQAITALVPTVRGIIP
jgi:choline-glycine betaine transporter